MGIIRNQSPEDSRHLLTTKSVLADLPNTMLYNDLSHSRALQAAHRGSLNVPALPAGSRVERNALTPLRGTRSLASWRNAENSPQSANLTMPS